MEITSVIMSFSRIKKLFGAFGALSLSFGALSIMVFIADTFNKLRRLLLFPETVCVRGTDLLNYFSSAVLLFQVFNKQIITC